MKKINVGSLVSVIVLPLLCIAAKPDEAGVSSAHSSVAPLKTLYYPMSSDPRHWGAVPAGCEPYVCDGGGRYINNRGKEDSWWVGGYYGVGATAKNKWKPTGEFWQHCVPEKVAEGLKDYPKGTLYVLDWEHLPVDVRTDGDADVEDSIQKMRAFFVVAKAARPDMHFALYAMPLRDYWVPTHYFADVDAGKKPSTEDAKAWADLQNANTRFTYGRLNNGERDAGSGLTDTVDVLCPSGYDFYVGDDQGAFIRASVSEARRIGDKRPVAMFAWHRYHNSNAEVGLQPIPLPEWRTTMRQMFESADAVVLWEAPPATPPAEYVKVALEERDLASWREAPRP